MATAETIIERARYETAAWEELRQPHGAILRRLNVVIPQLYLEALRFDPTFQATLFQHTVTQAEVDGTAIDLGAHLAVVDDGGTHVRNNNDSSFTIVPYGLRFQPPGRPAAYIIGTDLYLADIGADWRAGDQINLFLVPEPATLTLPSETVPLPDKFLPWLHWEACMALEGQKPTGLMQIWAARADAARLDALNALLKQRGRRRVKEVV